MTKKHKSQTPTKTVTYATIIRQPFISTKHQHTITHAKVTYITMIMTVIHHYKWNNDSEINQSTLP